MHFSFCSVFYFNIEALVCQPVFRGKATYSACYKVEFYSFLIYNEDVKVKAPGYDTCGLFRALHSHNPAQSVS